MTEKRSRKIEYVRFSSLIFISLIVFSTVSCKTAKPEGTPKFTEPKELTSEQLWAIALTGIMSERNGSSHIYLNSSDMTLPNRYIWLRVLSRDWDITNREELLETLKRMEENGHAGRLSQVQQIITEGVQEVAATKDEDILIVYTAKNMHELSARVYNYLEFTYLNWEIFKNRTINAWDLGRNIALCRWGYQVGFITEDEAWENIMYYARLIQQMYNSWEEYGTDYYMGRIFWASGFGEVQSYLDETQPIYEKLISEGGLWHNMEWNIDLK